MADHVWLHLRLTNDVTEPQLGTRTIGCREMWVMPWLDRILRYCYPNFHKSTLMALFNHPYPRHLPTSTWSNQRRNVISINTNGVRSALKSTNKSFMQMQKKVKSLVQAAKRKYDSWKIENPTSKALFNITNTIYAKRLGPVPYQHQCRQKSSLGYL